MTLTSGRCVTPCTSETLRRTREEDRNQRKRLPARRATPGLGRAARGLPSSACWRPRAPPTRGGLRLPDGRTLCPRPPAKEATRVSPPAAASRMRGRGPRRLCAQTGAGTGAAPQDRPWPFWPKADARAVPCTTRLSSVPRGRPVPVTCPAERCLQGPHATARSDPTQCHPKNPLSVPGGGDQGRPRHAKARKGGSHRTGSAHHSALTLIANEFPNVFSCFLNDPVNVPCCLLNKPFLNT